MSGPRTKTQIEALLERLEHVHAEALESQDLDFKQWAPDSMHQSVRTAVAAAVCMANGGGGTVVFGVADSQVGRDAAILGVPAAVSVSRLRLAVHDGTDPTLTPVFEELLVREGTGRLILMHVHPGVPPYTDTAGRGTIRIGTDCKPLTGTMRRKLIEESGEDDYTGETIDASLASLISPKAMELLREAARAERAPDDLLRLPDSDVLAAIGVVRGGRPTRAAVLLAGSPSAVREHAPLFLWTHLRMSSPGDYSDRADGTDAIPVALASLLDRIMADNPIETVPNGPYHFEYRTYPEVALREALLNALCHGDFRIASPRLVKQSSGKIEITNPGGFVGGITSANILHHAPTTRNPRLVEALARLRLVNRSNLGMERIFSALLMEGKPPPLIEDCGESIRLSFRASKVSAPFRRFVAGEAAKGTLLASDHLLILRHLLREVEIDAPTAAGLCHRSEAGALQVLSTMETGYRHLNRSKFGGQPSWTLRRSIRAQLAEPWPPGRIGRTAWENAKVNVLKVMRRKAAQGEAPLANSDVREITAMDRFRVTRLIRELSDEGRIRIQGRGRGTRYIYTGGVRAEGEM